VPRLEDPEARAPSEAVIALEKNGDAHGGAQLVVLDDGDEPMRLLDLVEDMNDAVVLIDFASGRVEEQDHAMGERSVLIKRAAQIMAIPCTMGPDHSIMSEPSFLSNSNEEVGAGHCSSDAASAKATGRVSAAIATAAARQAANVKSRTMALVRMPAV
jgi:hypothetical protein